MKRYLVLIGLLLACSSPLLSQDGLTLNLEQAINIALNKSYTIKSYNESKLAAEHYFKYWEAQFKPRLDYTLNAPSWAEGVSMIEQADGLPVYNSTGLMTYSSTLDLTIMLPTGGNFSLQSQFYRQNNKTVLALQDYRTLTSRKARSSFTLNFSQPIFTKNTKKEGLEEARLEYERSSSVFSRHQMDIIYNVTAKFYDVYRLTRKVEISREKLENSREAVRIARLMADAGRVAEVDVLTSEVTANRDRAELSSSENELERVKDDFKQLIGMSQFDDFRIMTNLVVEDDSLLIDPELAIEKALLNRREIVEAELDIELAEIDLDKAKREREFSGNIEAYYDITGVSTREHGSTTDLFQSAFDNIDDRPPNRGITLTFSYPIFDWGRGKHRVQRQTAYLRRYKLNLENQRVEIIREVRDIVRSVEEAKSRLEIHKENEQRAQQVYRINRLLFEQGKRTSRDLAQEQEALTNAQLGYLGAYIEYQLQLADLKRKTLWDFKNNVGYLETSCFRTEE